MEVAVQEEIVLLHGAVLFIEEDYEETLLDLVDHIEEIVTLRGIHLFSAEIPDLIPKKNSRALSPNKKALT
jgi:hypothetical protein